MDNDTAREIELQAYVDGELDPARMLDVEDYLARHPEAASRVMGDLRTRNALRLLSRTDEAVSPRHLDAARRLADGLARSRRRPRLRLFAQSAALVALLGAALLWTPERFPFVGDQSPALASKRGAAEGASRRPPPISCQDMSGEGLH